LFLLPDSGLFKTIHEVRESMDIYSDNWAAGQWAPGSENAARIAVISSIRARRYICFWIVSELVSAQATAVHLIDPLTRLLQTLPPL